MSPFLLTDKIALVTGAARGLGFEMAKALADAGAVVLVHGREPAPVELAVTEIIEHGGRAHALLFDLADDHAIERAIRDTVERFGRLDILVNNAGTRDRRSLAELQAGAVRHVLEIDLVAPFQLARLLTPHLSAGGRIINISSIAGQIARSGDPAYTAAKGGLEALTRALAAELGPHGITVNAIAPGYFASAANAEMVADPAIGQWLAQRTSLGRWGMPHEIGGAVVFLASSAASFITGQTLAIDGGHITHF